ncbi:MAG: hypothetical protein MI742_01515, partial [Desulfobacterales bacterium]|nr:hypothetical protein [Desulfobacterales bacterium]
VTYKIGKLPAFELTITNRLSEYVLGETRKDSEGNYAKRIRRELWNSWSGKGRACTTVHFIKKYTNNLQGIYIPYGLE